MDLRKLPLRERIMSLTAFVLLFDLLFLPWHRVDLGLGGTYSRSAVDSPNGFLGLLAALILAAIVARVVVSEFTTITLPALPMPWERVDLVAAAAVAGVLFAKVALETSYVSVGAWLAFPLAAGLIYGCYQQSRENATSPDLLRRRARSIRGGSRPAAGA